jgi:hypothetical protein
MKQPKDKKPKYEMKMTLLCTKPRRSIKLTGIPTPDTTGGYIGFYPIFIPTG